MKKLFLITIIIAFLFLLTACDSSDNTRASGDNAENEEFPEMTITFSHNQPLESPEHAGAEKFKEIVEEKSGGNITVDIYPSSQLGRLREQVESTQIGEIDITMQPVAVVTPFVDDVKIIDLPYLWPTDTNQMYRVMDSEVGKDILATMESARLKGFGFWPGGYKLFTTKDVEVRSPDDLKGLTMRIMESSLLIDQYKFWGGNAIPVPYAEVYNALQQGIVDGQENPLHTIFMNNYHEVQGNVIESFHGPMVYILMSNKSWFDGLNENVQSLIVEAEKEGRTAVRESLKETEDEYRQKIIDSDVNYYEFTNQEIEKFREASEPFWEEVYNTPEQLELLEKVKEALGN